MRRIVYLGGLGAAEEHELSEHLRSRQQTGDVLRASGVPVVELRASIVIGSGSLSYEMVRALVERLPVMVCPRWVQVRTQPIAIDDLVAYVLAAARPARGRGRACTRSAGPTSSPTATSCCEYARQRGLRRWLIPVPLLTPRLSSLWLGLVTPLYARVGRKLIESLRNPTVVTSDRARAGVRHPAAPAARRRSRAPLPRGRGAGRHALVGRALLGGAVPALGRHALRHAAGGQPVARGARRSPPAPSRP